jgi:threonine/homoserine/homoserine lactone efflux protein
MRDAFRSAKLDQGGAIDTQKGAFRSGMAISIANPMAVGYWLSIGGTLVATGVAGQSSGQTATLAFGFVAGTFLWAFIMAVVVRFGKRILHPNLFRVINFGCGAALRVFGITLATQMLG